MELPYLTPELPGIGGTIKTEPEDFRVEEIPLYPFAGEGQHVFFKIRKRGVSTFDAIRKIARAMKLPEEAFGYAGLKDRQAVTEQWLSLEYGDIPLLQRLRVEGVEILEITRHRHKLKIGHLKGNRFQIRIRGVGQEGAELARAILAVLGRRGVPAYYDRQRFGVLQNSHIIGKALLLGAPALLQAHLLGESLVPDPRYEEARAHYRAGRLREAAAALPGRFTVEKRYLSILARTGDPERAMRSIYGKRRMFFMSAFQSYLFNRLMIQRLPRLDRLLPGDLAYLHGSGRIFRVADPAAEGARLRAFEISPSGPIFGYQVPLAEGEPGTEERRVLAEEGLTLEHFRRQRGLRTRGTRRPYRFPLWEPAVEVSGEDLIVRFALPKGAYATIVLRELMKTEATLPLLEMPG